MSSAVHVPPTLAHGRVPRVLWFLLTLAAGALLVAQRADHPTPGRYHLVPVATVVITTAYAGALAHRAGGRPVVSALVALVLGTAAVTTDVQVLDAGLAVGTTVLAGLLALMVTVPARNLLVAVREVLVATAVAGVGALAVAAYHPEVDAARFRYVALGAALVAMLALVLRLGAGLHGLGRRGALTLVVGTALLVAAVAYGEALSRWGSPELVDGLERVRTTLRDQLGAVPHPIEALLGYPALLWGTWMRARRRQGWWVLVFAVAATIPTAYALVDPAIGLRRVLLGAGYSLVLGVLLGWLVIRVDLFLTGPHGSRARRDEEAHALRPEPGRTRAPHPRPALSRTRALR